VSTVLYARVSTSEETIQHQEARLAPRGSRSTMSLPTTVYPAFPPASPIGLKGVVHSICRARPQLHQWIS
jgi:hypothetical protein